MSRSPSRTDHAQGSIRNTGPAQRRATSRQTN
jgi:hypothetical protein